MNFNIILCIFVLLLSKDSLLGEGRECVQRRLGACKVLIIGDDPFASHSKIILEDFQSPQPKGFVLKTSIEINLLANKHSFEKNLPVEKKRPVEYDLDNAARVVIEINMGDTFIRIYLGKKYYRLARLEYYDYTTHFHELKFNRYTPVLPTFPYNLHLAITTNGTFSVYADAITEPFFMYQLDKRPNVKEIIINTAPGQIDLIAFVDCSLKYKSNCGIERVDRLYSCREWNVKIFSTITSNFEGFQKTYNNKNVLFDEFVVVNTEFSSKLDFTFHKRQHRLRVDFRVDNIQVTFNITKPQQEMVKRVKTKQWFEVPASPYAIRMLITNGTNNNFLHISNIRGDEILSMNLCEDGGSIDRVLFSGPELYLDCMNHSVNHTMLRDRPRKTDAYRSSIKYHQYGYNYTKHLLDTRKFVNGLFVLYEHEFGNTTKDWCVGDPKPKVFATSKNDDGDSLHAVVEDSNEPLLAELQRIRSLINTTADVNAAVLYELQKINAQINATVDTNKAILLELQKEN